MALDWDGRLVARMPSPVTEQEIKEVQSFFLLAGVEVSDEQAAKAFVAYCQLHRSVENRLFMREVVEKLKA